MLGLPCRIVFAAGLRPIEVIAPLLEDDSELLQKAFGSRRGWTWR